MMRIFPFLVLTILAFSTGCQADSHQHQADTEKTIRANVSRLPHFKVDAVKPLDSIPGLYEIRSGSNIFYTDASGDHLISGHIFSTKDHKDLTAARLEDINRVDWNKLPLKDAIVSGDMNGTPVAIFTDPECPYCRRLEHALLKVKGIKVYTFLFPLSQIHPTAHAQAEAIWCAKDQYKTLQDIMLKNISLDKIKTSKCKTPISDNLKLAASLHITGTPTLIAHDGRKHAGVMHANELMQWANK